MGGPFQPNLHIQPITKSDDGPHLLASHKKFGFNSPNRACGVGVLTGLLRAKGYRGVGPPTLIDKNAYLVTPALVSPTRNRWSRAQTWKNTIENKHFFVKIAPEASWFPQKRSFGYGRPQKSRTHVKRKHYILCTPIALPAP